MKRYGDLFIKYLKPMWPKAALLAALVFISIGLQLANPQIIRYFIDAVIADSEVRSLLLIALAFLGVSLLTQVVGIAATYVGEDVGWRATNQLRTDLTDHCLRLDMSFHNARTPGEMIERIDGDILTLAKFFSRFVIRILGNLLLLVGVLLLLALEDWRITLALLTYTVLGLAGLSILRRIAVPYWKATRQASADLFGFLEEQLAGTEDVRSSGAVPYVMRNLFKFNKTRLNKELKSSSMDTFLAMTWVSLYVLGQVVAFASSYALLRQGVFTIGTVYLVIYYTHFVFLRLLEVATEVQKLQQAAASIERVETLFTIESKISNRPVSVALPAGPVSVVFDNITFGYTEAEPVLQNVSFQLPPGKVLGLLGRTGSGKTTLTSLLFRLYDPTQGIIRLGVNGHQPDIREIALDDLRQRIGLVTQNVQLFQATVRDNLTFFDDRIPDEQILQVIEELQLFEWYDSLPNGLDTELETEGNNLSAGEAQLLAFTRVFLSDPDLVILDEASSRLDPATEKLIERAIDRLLENRTGIIVAHRLSTVHRVDTILIIEGGQIQEFGQYADLAHDPTSRFYHLLQTGLEEVLA
jgi:ATP-binding cassette subfamily B protein/ATP-binding cassette subfamily C protein